MAVPMWLASSVALLTVMAVAVAISTLSTALAVAYARRHGLIDVPGIRRSHRVPTPRGGGIGIVLAAFLCAIDALVQEGPYLVDKCRVLYISPLRALSNDVQKNLLREQHQGLFAR